MHVILPPSVQPVLNDYIALVDQAVPQLLVGLYLHGSLALGAYNPGLSDVDFIAVISRRSSASDSESLHTIHQTLAQRYPQAQLSGSYLQWEDVGKSEATIQPHPHYHDDVFYPSGYHDINGVTWWVLKHRGITLRGPAIEHFHIQINWNDLVAKMHENLNTYWASFTTNPRRVMWLLDNYGIQ